MLAAVLEEPLFRGFLWGWLRKKGKSERAIWLIQSVVFFCAHLQYAAQGRWFEFGAMFAAGLIFGALAWRTRSLVPAMLAHALLNCIGGLVIYGG